MSTTSTLTSTLRPRPRFRLRSRRRPRYRYRPRPRPRSHTRPRPRPRPRPRFARLTRQLHRSGKTCCDVAMPFCDLLAHQPPASVIYARDSSSAIRAAQYYSAATHWLMHMCLRPSPQRYYVWFSHPIFHVRTAFISSFARDSARRGSPSKHFALLLHLTLSCTFCSAFANI